MAKAAEHRDLPTLLPHKVPAPQPVLAACTGPRVSLTSEMSHRPKDGGAVTGFESLCPSVPCHNKEVHFCLLSTDPPAQQ